MTFTYEDRPSDSPFVETIWHTESMTDGDNTVVADVSWDMIIHTWHGKPKLTIWGPMSETRQIPYFEGDSWLGIRFKLGTFMPDLPINEIPQHGIALPQASGKQFWLDSNTWEMPTFENADTFLAKLARTGLITRDPVVEAVLRGQMDEAEMSMRSVQRRFLRATGLSRRNIAHIERAQHATTLLQQGFSILDTVFEAGYFDQAHLTRSMRRFTGKTPKQILTLQNV